MKNNFFIQFIKFGMVGFIGAIIDLGVFNLLAVVLDVNIYFSRSLSFTLAVINNYILNRKWTFQNKHKDIAGQFSKFFIISLIGLILNLLIMRLLQSQVGGISNEILRKNIPVVIAIMIVLIWNFLANKYWTFREK